LLAIAVVLLLISLLFNFEEIFGQTPADAAVELDEENSESDTEQEADEAQPEEEKSVQKSETRDRGTRAQKRGKNYKKDKK